MLKLTDLFKQAIPSFRRVGGFALVCTLAACTQVKNPPVSKQPAPVLPPVVEKKPASNMAGNTLGDSTDQVEKDIDKASTQVAVVLSSNSEIYKQTGRYILKRLDDRAKLFTLSSNVARNKKLLNDLQRSDRDQIVAIGLTAAQAVSALENKQIIFSYVFNYRDHDLVKENIKGVSALPGATQLFRDWKALSPVTRKVVVITGHDLDDYVISARRAARAQNIELVHIIVATDKEFLYQTKHLSADIQGQWIIPDNRVLSRKTLKEALTYNSKEGKQTVVFSPSLLKLGGLFYSRISPAEVSKKILRRLQDGQQQNEIPGVDVQLLDGHEIGINPVVAKQLGLTVPPTYKKYLNE